MVRFPLVAALILGFVLGLPGCTSPAPPPGAATEGVTLPELAPPPVDRPPPPAFFNTVSLDIHVLDLPADNVDRLGALWQILSAGPIRLTSYNAFTENSFRLLYGKVALWEKIQALLAQADAQPVTIVTLTLADNDSTDLPIAQIPVAWPIAFVGTDLSQQIAHVGPGMLVLRLWAQPNPWARGVRKIVGRPTYTIPVTGAIPQLQAQALRREFPFEPTAFACQMGPGDLLVLGPEKYTGERGTLGGLFFNKPDETLFFNPSQPKPPARKGSPNATVGVWGPRPAVRLYLLVCTAVQGA